MPLLPSGMPSPPSFRKNNPNDQPILMLNLTSNTLPLSALDDYAETMIAPRISMVSGVSQVQVQGASKYAVRVQLDPDKLHAQKIGLNEIDQALQNWNVNLPTGQLFGPDSTYNIKAGGQLMNAAAFRPIIVSYRRGAPVRLDQVANVIDSIENVMNGSWFYTKPGGPTAAPLKQTAITLQVMRQPGTNTIEVTDAVRALLPSFESQLPPSVHLTPRQDESRTIRAAFSDIQITMLVTLVLVVGVIYLFLHNASATLIPALALPFSILGTFAVMQMLHFSLNNLSMMALILSIGFVVDDAIVMLENIVRHMEAGEKPLEASLKGSQEIGFTILTMTTSLAAVFIPILFMSGILGRLFREFAVTITTAILISGVVSVTLTPMLCSRFLKVVHTKKGFAGLMDRAFDALLHGYEWSLRHVLRHRVVMLGVFVAVACATVHMFNIIPTGFIPDQDNDSMFVNLQAAQGTSYYDMAKWTQQVADVVIRNKYVDSFLASVGGGPGGGGSNNGRIMVQLVPRAQRDHDRAADRPADPAAAAALSRLPRLRRPAALSADRRAHGQPELQHHDAEHEHRRALRVGAEAAGGDRGAGARRPGPLHRHGDEEPAHQPGDRSRQGGGDRPERHDRRRTRSTTRSARSGSTTIYGDTAQYRVLLELDPKYQGHIESLEKVAFKAPNGALVPLQSVIDFKETVGPQSINHSGQLPSVSVSFGLKPGVSLGAATAHVKQVADRLLPPTITTSFEGQAKVFQQSMSNLGLLLFVAIGVVYIVLGALYESYIHPITILSGLPSAGLGALVTLYLFGNELNIYSFVGLVMLIGIVKKNAIMQIDFALEAERKHGKTPTEAIYEGCIIRFRPIMMTTMAALLGVGADRARLRRRRRGAAAARPRGGRRPGRLAADHALSDAGRLHLHGRPVQDAQDSRNRRIRQPRQPDVRIRTESEDS